MKAMILAAGFGTRLRPYTLVRPKPLFPVLNVPLITIIIGQLRAAGCGTIVVNLHHLGSEIEKVIGGDRDIVFQHESEILGTGGALRMAMAHFDRDPVVVVNGDIFHTIDLAALMTAHREAGTLVTLAMHDLPNANTVSVDVNGAVSGFARFGPLVPGHRQLAYMGIQIVQPQVFARLEAGRFVDLIEFYQRVAVEEQGIRAFVTQGHFWTDMGTPQDYLHLHQALLIGEAMPPDLPLPLARRPFCVDDQALVARDCHFQDWVAIGAGASIGAGARLTRTVVWDGAVVMPGTTVTDAIVY